MPIASVIIPIYNAELYLPRMFQCIQYQTLTDFEVLLIDDGSIDGSAIMCDEICQKDNRFRVVHKKNSGVGSARQTGLDLSTGEYVIHADADDWVKPNMLEELYLVAKDQNADIVICDFYVDTNDKVIYRSQEPSSTDPKVVLRELFQQLHGSCWNKLVKRSCLKKYGARFFEGIDYCEDKLFWIQLLQHKEVKIAYHPHAYYHYVMNDNSITNHYTEKSYQMWVRFSEKLREVLVVEGFEDCIRKTNLQVLFGAFRNRIIPDKKARQMLYRDNLRAAFCDNKCIRYKFGFFSLLLGGYSIAHKLLNY